MHFTAADENISPLQRDQYYGKLATANIDGIDQNKVGGFGALANEHSLFQKAILGFLPKWCLKKNCLGTKIFSVGMRKSLILENFLRII